MIAYLIGTLVQKESTSFIVDVNGVGYFLKVSLTTSGSFLHNDKIKIFTHLHITEDAHTLFGFASEHEKTVFLHLISISGVGPNTALMVLSTLTAEETEVAILSEDVKTIQAVKGIGIKTAQRIILELKDKVKKGNSNSESTILSVNSANSIKAEALAALIMLGIQKASAEKMLELILKKTPTIGLEELIKTALKSS